jgi:hypothetical protein
MKIMRLLYLSMVSFPLWGCCEYAPTSYFSIRDQGFNTARHVAGLSSYANIRCYNDNFCALLSVAPEYGRSFNGHKIRESLFPLPSGCDCDDEIRITGSRVENRQPTDWLADYFYLPTDFSSTLHFTPVIDHFLVDFNAIFYLDNWIPGLSVILYAPLVHTRWDLHMHEDIIAQGANPHDAGYFSPQPIPRSQLLTDFRSYARGDSIDPIIQVQDFNNPASQQIVVTVQPLLAGKISPKRRVKTRFADLRFIINYNCFSCDRYCLGFNLHIAAPTGNRPKGEYLFEPIAGNGHHTEVGGGCTGYVTLCDCNPYDHSMLFRWDATVTHLFGTRQKRVFDLAGKPFSRYMLAEKLGIPIIDSLTGNNGVAMITPTAQFQNQIAPLANLTNTIVEASAAAQADITIWFTINSACWSCDVGYGFWARSGEVLKKKGINVLDNNMQWALKGDTFVYGFEATSPTFPAVPLSGTQSNATINSGLNFPATGTTDPTTIIIARANPNVDNPLPASSNVEGNPLPTPVVAQPAALGPSNPQSFTSVNSVFIQPNDIQICAAPKTAPALSSKFFVHFSYTFDAPWAPFLGIGGQVEAFHHISPPKQKGCSQTMCDQKIGPSRLNQWSVWIKAGFVFDSSKE